MGDERDVRALSVPLLGSVVATGDRSAPYAVLAADGLPVRAVRDFMVELSARDCSPATCRSYALALLRWLRFLSAVEVGWERAGRVEVRDFVLWLRSADNPQRRPGRAGANPVTGKRLLGEGYAPATINHALSVISAFYDHHLAGGAGPVVNPVPVARAGETRRQAHHNPIEPYRTGRRAPYRQRAGGGEPRAMPDEGFEAFFAALDCDRDRAMVAVAVSSGARAGELLGMQLCDLDVGAGLVGLIGKGSRVLRWVPVSPDALAWTGLYLAGGTRPVGAGPLWWTLRAPARPLTYTALRAVLARANARLGGANWTMHDLRHTYAMRLAADPRLRLTDVQALLRHESLAATQVYLRPALTETLERVRAHREQSAPAAVASGYDPADLAVLFGTGAE